MALLAAMSTAHAGSLETQSEATDEQAATNIQAKSKVSQLETVVVSATREVRDIRDVPMSISALDQQKMDDLGVRRVDDVVRLTPNINLDKVASHNGSRAQISIRGVKSNSGTPTTGIYINDTPIQIRTGTSQSATNAYPLIFDLERVEVLRGPQGTLFGTGAMGGAVRFITPTPSLDFYSVYARGGVEQVQDGGSGYEAGVAIGGPIIEGKLGFRLSTTRRHEAGWIDHIQEYSGFTRERNANWSETDATQLSFLWKPTENLSIKPWVFHQEGFSNTTSMYDEWVSDPGRKEFRQENPLSAPTNDRFTLSGIDVNYDLTNVTLISSTSFFDRKASNFYDLTWLEFASQAGIYGQRPEQFKDAYAFANLLANQKNFTQEFRIQSSSPDARIRWVVGAYYAKTKVHDYYAARNDWLLPSVNYSRAQRGLPLCATVPDCYSGVDRYLGLYSLYLDTHMQDREYAVFGQADIKLTDKLTATAGLRYADMEYTHDQFRAGTQLFNNGEKIKLSQSESPVTPKLGLQYQIAERSMLFASAAKGYRPGAAVNALGARCQADADALGIANAPRQVSSDSIWSYEIGSKNTLIGGRLQLDASAFNIKWDNIQTYASLPCSIPTIFNMGNARSRGIEVSGNFRATEALTLSGSFGYTDSEYTTTVRGSGTTIIRSAGEPVGSTPWSVYLGGQYNFSVLGRDAYFRSDYSYTAHDDTPLDIASYVTNPDIPRPEAYHNLDLRLAVDVNGVEVAAYVQNAFNESPLLGRYENTFVGNHFRAMTLRPRTFGFNLIYRY